MEISTEQVATFSDEERLDWLVRSGAHVCYDNDGDIYWLRWEHDPNDEEKDRGINNPNLFHTQREAIDAAMLQAGLKPMSDREKLIREAFCFDSDRDRDAARYLLGVIDVIREDRNRMREQFNTEPREREKVSMETLEHIYSDIIDKHDVKKDSWVQTRRNCILAVLRAAGFKGEITE